MKTANPPAEDAAADREGGPSHSSATAGGKGSGQENAKFRMAFRARTNLSVLPKDRLQARRPSGDSDISAMNSNDSEERRREEFLARAREAEARAAKTTDPMLRESWLKVAEGYHKLAQKK